MFWNKQTKKLDLIDLEEYAKNLIDRKQNNNPRLHIPPIPYLEYTEAEKLLMSNNRCRAFQILEDIYGEEVL